MSNLVRADVMVRCVNVFHGLWPGAPLLVPCSTWRITDPTTGLLSHSLGKPSAVHSRPRPPSPALARPCLPHCHPRHCHCSAGANSALACLCCSEILAASSATSAILNSCAAAALAASLSAAAARAAGNAANRAALSAANLAPSLSAASCAPRAAACSASRAGRAASNAFLEARIA